MDAYRSERGTYFTGLQTCGHTSCPVCGPAIRERERARVAALVAAHLDAGGSVYLFLLTVSHGPLDSAGAVVAALDAGRAAAIGSKGGSRWALDRKRYAIAGTCWHREELHGRNGWHFHTHGLLFTDRELTGDELDALQKRVFGRHRDALRARGFDASDRFNGIERVLSPESVAGYLTKQDGAADRIAAELTRGDLKRGKGMTPGAILDSFTETGDLAALNLFRDYEQACEGRRWRYLSPALAALYGVSIDAPGDVDNADDGQQDGTESADAQDAQDARDDVGGQLVCRIPLTAWRVICGRLGTVSHLRSLIHSGDLDGARQLVASAQRESETRARDRPAAWGASRRRGSPIPSG